MLWDQSSGLFRPEAAFGFDLTIMREMGLRAGESITGKVYDDGRSRLLATAQEVERDMADMRPANRAVRARAIGGSAWACSPAIASGGAAVWGPDVGNRIGRSGSPLKRLFVQTLPTDRLAIDR
jgi:hypothetical protein